MRRALPFLVLLAIAATARGDMPGSGEWAPDAIPIEPPERPFLLVDAPRRFTPDEPAKLRVQLQHGGEAQIALFRVRTPASLLGLAGNRSGIAVAQTPIGLEAEGLLSGDLARGQRLDLVRTMRVRLVKPRQARRIGDETEVYDSNEDQEDEIATYWVHTGEWAVREVALGRLAAGLYLARVHTGPYATSALLSVGELVLLARRGDTHDAIHVTDANGQPVAGVAVRAEADGQVLRRGVTDARGSLRMPAADAPVLRYVAERGADVAWADVSHARLSPCDPRVYLATGRPTYRDGETVYVRGHVRGCDAEGRFVALADELVTLSPAIDTESAEVRTDADGNFVARLRAQATLTATIRGKAQEREIRIDHRALPVRGITVRTDRPFAVAGQVLRVTVTDDEGGWPTARDVVLDTPVGRRLARIGPRAPAVFHVPVPGALDEPVARWTLTATLADASRVTTAATEIWVGRTTTLLELDTTVERGVTGGTARFTVRARDLLGQAEPGPVRVTLHGTDGNRPRGPARWEASLTIPASGDRAFDVPLGGDGPWWIEAKRGRATGHAVLWARERPPSLAARGPLAVMPATERVRPSERVAFDVRVPAGQGASWITLEQGSVWAERSLTGAGGRTVRVELPVPGRARGLAKIVVAHVARGEVTTASATVDVATSEEVSLRADTDRRVYAQGERAHVTIAATKTDGSPSDGVASLWLADAGYWEMGEETYPLPGEYLRLPGRMASGADSTQPIAYGAEEGRVLPDARMEWNGQRIDGTTHRHAWGHYGRIVRVRRQGRLDALARDLARGAGLAGAWFCPDTVRDVGAVHVVAHDLPWDLVAVKIAERTQTEAHVQSRVLRFECPGAAIGLGGMGGLGHGSGGGGGGMGIGRVGRVREERLEGTLRFIGLVRLGPDGRHELDLELPDHPGRWRIESLVIADDGGGARAHAIVHTQRALEAWTDTPPRLAPGDEAPIAVSIRAPSMARRSVELAVAPSAGVRLVGALPARVTLDARGEARVQGRIAAVSEGDAELVVRASAGTERDDLRARIHVTPAHTTQPVAMRTLVGPEASDVHVPLPELSQAAELSIAVDSGLEESIEDALSGIMEPRWHLAAMRVDRLASMRALIDAASRLPDTPETRALRARLVHAHTSEAEALARLRTPSGGLAWWTGLSNSPHVTAEALWALGDRAEEAHWEPLWDAVRRHARADAFSGESAAIASLVLAGSGTDGDRALSRALLDQATRGTPTELGRLTFALLAARAHEDRTRTEALSRHLRAALRARVADGGDLVPCRGPIWFLCYERWGERAELARAASALFDARHAGARSDAIAVVRLLASRGPVEHEWVWGSAEADALALASRVMPQGTPSAASYRIVVDGRTVRPQRGRIRLQPGAHVVRIVFPARSDRIARIRVDGTVQTPPPQRHAGNVPLERTFEQIDGTWYATVSFDAPRSARGIDLALPLPAGLEPAGDPQIDTATSPHATPRMTAIDGTLHLHWPDSPGATRLRIPLIAVSEGTFAAAPARLRDASRTQWALTTALP